jgi:hypothetical protein
VLGERSIVKSPDGRRWRVRRRWVDRPVPSLREWFRRGRREVDGEDVVDGLFVADGFDGLGAIGAAIAIGVLILVLLPVLGVALELVALLLVLTYGLFARIVLRRPWIVEACDVEDEEDRVAFAIKGWRASSVALRELRTAIAAAGPPERLTVGRPLATAPASRARRRGA